jgi:hypothetical protein
VDFWGLRNDWMEGGGIRNGAWTFGFVGLKCDQGSRRVKGNKSNYRRIVW